MSALNPTRAVLLETFALDSSFVRATGHKIFDDDGREYLDFLSQYGALPLGHNPPEIWEALNEVQRSQVPSMVQPLRPILAERLAERLAEITPGDLGITTFANSGAEAVEAAIKLARVRTGRNAILSTRNGFHGKTLGALSATGKAMYQDDFGAPVPGFAYVPYGDLAALEARLAADADHLAAFIVEPIQGEGGVICPPDGYLEGAIALCRRHGVLCIFDEIQTGLGRTGKLFACSDCPEPPDMLLLAKALGGGVMPISACIARPSVWDDRFGRLHSSTFANNNVACAAGLALIDVLLRDDQALVRSVAENGEHLSARLHELQAAYPDVIRSVRGRGYMAGLEFRRFDSCRDSATMAFCSLNGGLTPLISSCLANVHGVLTAPLFNETHVLRLQPPLIAGRPEIDRAIAALTAVCDAMHRRDFQSLVRHLIKPASERSAAPASLPSAKETPGPAQAGRGGAGPLRLPHPLHRGGGRLPFGSLVPRLRSPDARRMAGLGQAARSGLRPRHPAGDVEDGRRGRRDDPLGADAPEGHARQGAGRGGRDDPGGRRHGRRGRGRPRRARRVHLGGDARRRDGDRPRRADHQREHADHRGRGEGDRRRDAPGRPAAGGRSCGGGRRVGRDRPPRRHDARAPRRADDAGGERGQSVRVEADRQGRG